jgi:porin
MNSRISKYCTRGASAVILGLTLLALAQPASAQPVDVPPTWGGTFWDRPRLTGSWGGLRDEMGKKGVVVDIDLTQVPQGVASGGRDNVTKYDGLAEYTLNVDSQKLGLWPGGFLNVKGMSSFGQNVNIASGAFSPPNVISILPQPGGNVTGLMSLTLMQFLSPHFGLYLGKLDTIDGADTNAFANDYHSQFLNTGLTFNMALDIFPFTAYGGGLVVLPWQGAVFTVSVVDPSGKATNNDLGEAFEDGVLVTAQGRVAIKPFGLVGHQLLGGAWSNKERPSLKQDPSNLARLFLTDQFPRLEDPGAILERFIEVFFPGLLIPVQPLNTVNSTWAIYYNFDQYLWSPEGASDRGIGVFFRFGASDGVANPVKYAYNVGIGGKGAISWRPCDSFGIGWSHFNISGNFAPFLRQQLALGLSKEDAIEMYYTAEITRWLNASVDLQIINQAFNKKLDASSSLQDMGTAVVLGMRIYSRF